MTKAIVVPLLWLLAACDTVTPPVPPPVEPPQRVEAPTPTKVVGALLHRQVFRASESGAPLTVFLHGYGSNEADMGGLARRLNLPGGWVGYRAPIAMASDRFAWFPVNFNAGPTQKRYDDAEVARAASQIITQLEAEGQPVRLAGFSQGGMLSFYVALQRPDLVTEAISFSGPGPLPESFQTPPKARMLLIHGSDDPVVALSRAHTVRDRLTQAGGSFDYIEVPGMAHQITDGVIQRALAWTTGD